LGAFIDVLLDEENLMSVWMCKLSVRM